MDYRYVIVGGGMAADAAVKSVRRADPPGSLLLVSAEADAPYRRPPLSKGLWNGDDLAKIGLGTGERGADLVLGDPVVALNVDTRELQLTSGRSVRYQRLLLATGASPRTLPPLPPGGPVLPYRSLSDFREAEARSGPGRRALVVGGGFIGSEVAAGLSRVGTEVHMAFQEEAISSLRFPAEIAEIVTADYRQRRVRVHSSTSVTAAEIEQESAVIALSDGTEERFDLVVVGVGATPNTELASQAGLFVDDGIVVDEHLRARRDLPEGSSRVVDPDLGVYAAGDVASFPWPRPFSRGRIEHEDNAVSMGAHAGREMVYSALSGRLEAEEEPNRLEREAYTHFPFFYSDLFDNGYEAVGQLDSRLDTLVVWHKPGEEAVVYYLDGQVLKGILLWNTWGQVDHARDMILAADPVVRDELRGRLPA